VRDAVEALRRRRRVLSQEMRELCQRGSGNQARGGEGEDFNDEEAVKDALARQINRLEEEIITANKVGSA
jgi:hypothetical protein